HHIIFGGHKGSSHKIHVVLNTKEKILFILLGEKGAGHDLVGEAHALFIAHHAAVNYGTDSIVALELLHIKGHKAVIYQNPVAYLQILDQILIAYGNFGLITFHLLGGEGKGIAVLEGNAAVFEGANPVLGAL